MTPPEIIQVKLPKNILLNLFSTRSLVIKYETNRTLKSYAFYALLKTTTQSGKLTNYKDQAKFLRKLFKCTRNTLPTIIAQLQQLKLIEIEGTDLKLVSFERAAELVELPYKRGDDVVIEYNIDSKEKIYHLFFAAEIAINQRTQLNAIQKKLLFNSEACHQLTLVASQLTGIDFKIIKAMPIDEFCKLIFSLQKNQFVKESKYFKLLNIVRVDVNRKLGNLVAAWGFKSYLSATYIKRKLHQLQLIKLEKQSPIYSECGNRIRTISKKYIDKFNHQNKLTAWFIPDQLNVISNIVF